MEGLDSIAKRYGVLPSQVLAVEDEYVAMTIDLWAHNWGVQKDAHDMREAQRRRGRRGR
jgi:hypothetical protein